MPPHPRAVDPRDVDRFALSLDARLDGFRSMCDVPHMRNTIEYGTTLDNLGEMIRLRLPTGWRVTSGRPASPGADSLLEIGAADESSSTLVVEDTRSLDPRDVPQAVLRLEQRARGRPLLFVAPFLSARTRDLLRDAGAGYVDSTGNIRLVLARPGLFIEARGSDKDPGSEPRPLRSLKGGTAGRVVRALCDLDPPYGVRDLAEKASISLGSVARVVGLLDREALVERDEAGRIEGVRRPELIRRWTQDYGLQSNQRRR